MEKIVVDILSVYPDISFGYKKSENITEISFDNRNNRNYKNNRNKLQNMIKMISSFVKHEFGLFVCYLRHIDLNKIVSNIRKTLQQNIFYEIP